MIKIEKVGSLYTANATPPHVRQPWSTATPMGVSEIMTELRSRGGHQTDIADAFYEADPEWL